MSSSHAVSVMGVSKIFRVYDSPRDRLWQILSMGKGNFYREFGALSDISFEVCKGEVVGILGRNGSGKSTLLQIIAGTLYPTNGQVDVNGKLAALLELGAGFNGEFTGRENIYLNGGILGLSRQEVDKKLEDIISFADIGPHLDQPVKTYSSGMYVRLAFAVQACIEPDVLIVDEALSVGDEKFQRKCFDYISKLRQKGCAILIVTHSTATIEKFCQRGVLLHKGRLHGIGPAKEIIDQYHALLYSDESIYRSKYLSRDREELSVSSMPNKAKIESYEILSDEPVFYTGSKICLRVCVGVYSEIQELQVGILLRTVEGINVFGTSTVSHDKNCHYVNPGQKVTVDFSLSLDLVPGTYFVSLAVADASKVDGMVYLDKHSDALSLKVEAFRSTSSGIAALRNDVLVSVESL